MKYVFNCGIVRDPALALLHLGNCCNSTQDLITYDYIVHQLCDISCLASMLIEDTVLHNIVQRKGGTLAQAYVLMYGTILGYLVGRTISAKLIGGHTSITTKKYRIYYKIDPEWLEFVGLKVRE